jgi:hypothetical protein
VLAQLTNNAVHTAVMRVKKTHLNGFISRNLIVDNNISNKCSEGNPGGNLRAVHDGVETETAVLKVTAECPITDLSKDGTR